MNAKSLLADVAKGTLAGYVATKAMTPVTTALYERESKEAREREDAVRGNKTAYQRAAERIAGLAGRSLSEDEATRWGTRLHWASGIGGGIALALLKRRYKGVGWGQGAAYGTGFFLLVDEAANSLFGFTPPPQAFPWQAHARGLVGHLAYGVAADTTLDALDRVVATPRAGYA